MLQQPLKADPAATLAKLIKLSNSNTQYEFKINSFLNILTWELDFEQSVLLILDTEAGLLLPQWRSESLTTSLAPIDLNGNMLGRCLSSRQSLLAEAGDIQALPPDWFSFAQPFLRCFLAIPLGDDKTVYGVLILLRRQAYELDHSRALLLEAVADALTMAIKNFQLTTDTRKRLSVLNVLSDLGRTLSSTIEVDRVMTMIPQIAVGIFLADGCTLNILDETGRSLLLSSHCGLIPPAYNFEKYLGSQSLPASVVAAMVRKTSFRGFLQDDPCALNLSPQEGGNTIISCPLSFQGRHQGSISLFNKLAGSDGEAGPKLFEHDDLEMLFSMNNMISGVLENAITFREVEGLALTNEMMVSYLSTIYDVSSALMTTVRYDELVWIISRALTERKGLAFDQVLILLLEQDEAGRDRLVSSVFWTYNPESEYYEQSGTLVDLLKNPSRQEAALMLERGRDMALDLAISPQSSSPLSQVALDREARLVFRDGAYDDELKGFGLKGYAAVPMVAKNQLVGVMAADRCFSEDTLSHDSLRDLTMLASQAGLAIENALLYDDLASANQKLIQVRGQLVEAERAAAQGEMGMHLAHEVRNPLVSIGGFTQRLLKKMKNDDPLKKYAQVIWEEVARVNQVLNNVLDFSRNEAGRVRHFSLSALVEETLDSLRHELKSRKITVKSKFQPDLPEISGDDRQIMHIILNLIYNASQAMGDRGGLIHLAVYETAEEDGGYVACEVTDTGPGIAEDMLHKLFTPFFTTKSQGSGLGLSIVKKIVDRYNGRIRVENHPSHIADSGASFTFMFPVPRSDSNDKL